MQHLQGNETRNCKFHDPTPTSRGGDFRETSEKLKYFLKNLLCPGTWSIQIKCIVMMPKKGSTKINKFITPGLGVLVLRCGYISYVVKIHYFFKILLLYSNISSPLLVYTRAWIRQIKYYAILTTEGSDKIVNFIAIGTGGFKLVHDNISRPSEYLLSSTLSIYMYITLIVIVLREYNAAFL